MGATDGALGWESGDLSFLCRAAADLLHGLRHVPYSPELQWCLSVAVLSPATPKWHDVLADEPWWFSRGRSSLSASVPHLCHWSVSLAGVMEIALPMKLQTEVTEMWMHIPTYPPSFGTSTVSSQGKQVTEAGNISDGCNFFCKSSPMKTISRAIKSDRQSQTPSPPCSTQAPEDQGLKGI